MHSRSETDREGSRFWRWAHNHHALAVLCFLFSSGFATQYAQAAAQATFVSSTGVDSNTSLNCARTAPCRTFAAALTVTNSEGEVIVLDSAEYGTASITQSVSITAPKGVYAGVTVNDTPTPGNTATPGIGVTASSLSITLRGLTFQGLTQNVVGDGPGVRVTGTGNSIVIRDCDFTGFYNGLQLLGGATSARILDTTFHDGSYGIFLEGGITATLSHIKLYNLSSVGVYVEDDPYSEVDVSADHIEWSAPSLSGGSAFSVFATAKAAQLYLDQSVIAGGTHGVTASGNGTGFAYVTVTNTLFSKVSTGVSTYQNVGGTAQLTLSRSTFNADMLAASSAGGGMLRTTGDNLFVGNGADVAGLTGLVPIGMQ